MVVTQGARTVPAWREPATPQPLRPARHSTERAVSPWSRCSAPTGHAIRRATRPRCCSITAWSARPTSSHSASIAGSSTACVALHADVALIDLHDAGFDVVRLCRALSTAQVRRIIVLSPEPLVDQYLIDLLDAGADDVIVDASPSMLDARVRVALRRSPPRPHLPPLLELGDLVVDLRAHEVQIAGRPVRCPPVQYELLHRARPRRRNDDCRRRSPPCGVGCRSRRRPPTPAARRRERAAQHPRPRPRRPRLETVAHARLSADHAHRLGLRRVSGSRSR